MYTLCGGWIEKPLLHSALPLSLSLSRERNPHPGRGVTAPSCHGPGAAVPGPRHPEAATAATPGARVLITRCWSRAPGILHTTEASHIPTIQEASHIPASQEASHTPMPAQSSLKGQERPFGEVGHREGVHRRHPGSAIDGCSSRVPARATARERRQRAGRISPLQLRYCTCVLTLKPYDT